MKPLQLAVVAILLCTTAFAQDLHKSKTFTTHHYTGVIGGKYKFLMNLYFDKENIKGVYRYYTQKDYLHLEGTYDAATKQFNLTESYYDHKKQVVVTTGFFEGIRNGNTVTGKWFNKDRSRTFDFTLSTDEKPVMFTLFDNSQEKDEIITTDAISVVYDTGTRQTITGFLSEVHKDVEFINLEDINFDGYLDLLVIEMTGAQNTPYFYWVYDPATVSFVRHEELTANDPVVDVQHQRIVSDWSGGAASHGQDQYVYQDGKFYLIESTEIDYTDNTTTVTKYKIENGRSVKL